LLNRGLQCRDIVQITGEAVAAVVLDDEDLSDEKLAKRIGVSRRAARRMRSGAESKASPAISYAAATRLVSRWLSEARFARKGKPRILPLDGPVSFATLASMAQVDPAAALPALKRAGVVRVSRGRVELRKDAYVPSAGEVEMLDILGRDGAEFLRAMIHNTTSSPARAMFQRKASYDNIGRAAMTRLREVLHKEAMRTLLAADRILAANDRDRNSSAPRGRRTRVSFGVYVSEEPVRAHERSRQQSAGRRAR